MHNQQQQRQVRHQLEYGALWVSVAVLDGMRRARLRHRQLREDERGVVSIEYVLIAAAAAVIAIVLGGIILDKVTEAGDKIKTSVEIGT